MILVLCGTHHQPFDRLVRAAAMLVGEGYEVVVQRGPSRVEVPGATVVDLVPPDRLEAWADAAEAIVTHAGPGSIFLAWDRGKVPVVVPRRPELHEHVDDHQVRFAGTLGGRAVVVEDTARIADALIAVRGVVDPRRRPDVSVASGFLARFSALAEAVAEGTHRPSGLLARLRHPPVPGSRRP
jgi:UDP-N-acetylglucosamine transferase subunit ALG13